MKVGVPRETAPGERRVALVPESVGGSAAGFEVAVERGAGAAAGFPDEEYAEAGRARSSRVEVCYGDADAVAARGAAGGRGARRARARAPCSSASSSR